MRFGDFLFKLLDKTQDDLAYDIGSVVIKVNSLAMQEELGFTVTHHVSHCYKFLVEEKGSRAYFQWTGSRTGVVTPTANLTPVQLVDNGVELLFIM